MSPENQELQYFVSAKESYMVISFLGRMTKNASQVLEACQADVLSSQAQYFILSFHDVQHVERPVIAALVRLQKLIREKNAEVRLRVCHLSPDLSQLLVDAGAVRREELKPNLQEALASVVPGNKVGVVKATKIIKGAA